MGSFAIDAVVIARAVVAAAGVFGDDPVVVMTTRSASLRRSRSPAAGALADVSGLPDAMVAPMLGVAAETLRQHRCRPSPRWWRAYVAASAAVKAVMGLEARK